MEQEGNLDRENDAVELRSSDVPTEKEDDRATAAVAYEYDNDSHKPDLAHERFQDVSKVDEDEETKNEDASGKSY